MGVATEIFTFDDTYARELGGLYQLWRAGRAPSPRLLVLNVALAQELGLDLDVLSSPEGVEVLVGNTVVEGSTPLAMAYAGHQFGGYSPRLGDGRALLLGEVIDTVGCRRDIHLKGSGRTPFARGGDGKAAVGPMLREYVIGEAMHALGIPTTRALAVIATGEPVVRESLLPGAVLVRVAASHLRVGTFQYAAATGDRELLRRLADYAIWRHHPGAADAANRFLSLFEHVVAAQASLVARWMQVGFIHGVMNTDNTTISGETIDYGPCAFMDRFDPATVFSSIDHGGRYAYGNQPGIMVWNLARLAETLLGLIDDDHDRSVEVATAALHSFGPRYAEAFRSGMREKLGIAPGATVDDEVIESLLELMREQRVDTTSFFRALSSAVRGDDTPARELLADPTAFDRWADRWRQALPADPVERAVAADVMDRANPLYVPRNHLVEEALAAATTGDLGPLHTLVDAVSRPFGERSGFERYAEPAPDSFGPYQTFCGT